MDEIEEQVMDGIQELREAGPRRPSQKLDLSNPGQINKEVVVALARKISPDLIAEKIASLLEATRLTKYGPAPDTRSQEAGIKLYLAYTVGLPTQRQEVITVNLDADSAIGLEARLLSSPALCDSLQRMIDKARQAVEVESVPE